MTDSMQLVEKAIAPNSAADAVAGMEATDSATERRKSIDRAMLFIETTPSYCPGWILDAFPPV